jgi:hypothetical protein
VTPEGVVRCDVAVAGETIAAIATPKALSAESAKHLNQKRRSPCARARGNDEELDRVKRCARVGSLERYEKDNRKAEPQATFLEVEPRATRPDS